jgi:hypothetical protein
MIENPQNYDQESDDGEDEEEDEDDDDGEGTLFASQNARQRGFQ